MNKTEKLVKKAKEGDKAAFETLYSEFSDKVYFFALRNVGGEDTARDITSETFVQALEGIKTLRSEKAFESWLFSIAYKKCMDHLRVINRDENYEDNEQLEKMIDTSGLDEPVMLPDDYAENADTAAKLKAVIDGMPADLRSAVLLYYYEDMPVSAVAKAMGISETNAKQKLFKARKQLRKKLEKLIGSGAVFAAVPLRSVIRTAFTESGAGIAVSGGAKVAGIGLTAKLAALGTAAAVAVGVPIAVHKTSGGGDYRPEDDNASQVIAEEIYEPDNPVEETAEVLAEYEYYHDLQELSNAAGSVFFGTVTKRFTTYMGDVAEQMANDKSKTDRYIGSPFTIYQITVKESLKGIYKTGDILHFTQLGDGDKVTSPQFIDLESEQSYLFFCCDASAVPINPEQGVYYQSGDEYLPVVKSNVETIKITEDDLKRLFPEYDANENIGESNLSVDKGVDVKKYDESKYTAEQWYTMKKGIQQKFTSIVNDDLIINNDSNYDKTSLVNKMFNSSSYYDVISGTMNLLQNKDELYKIEFMFDSEKNEAFETDLSELNKTNYYLCKNKLTIIDDVRKNISSEDISPFDKKDLQKDISQFNSKYDSANPEIANRHYVDRDGIDNYYFDTSVMMTPFIKNCIMPQELIFGLLLDESLWEIIGETNYLKRECIIIQGVTEKEYGTKLGVEKYNIFVDKETGVWLRFEGIDYSGNLSRGMILDDINILSHDQALQYYETKNDSFISPLFEKKISESSTYSGYDALFT